MAGDGMSVKERLMMLQGQGSKNELLSGKFVAHPVSNHKNQAPPTQTKPFIPALKPVTPPNKPGTAAADNSPGGAKPPTALKPPLTPPKPPVSGDSNSKEAGQQNSPLFPKLRPVGSPGAHSEALPFVHKKPTSPSQDSSSEGAEGGGSGGGEEAAMTTDKMDSGVQRGAGIQAKLEALKRKASVDNDKGIHPIRPGPAVGINKFGGGGPGKVVNGESGAKPVAVDGKEGAGVQAPNRPSDLIKTINQAAADKVLRDSNKADSENQNRRKSGSEIFLRNSDGKRFRQVDVGSVTSSDPAPAKPCSLEGVDLASFLKAYAAAKEEKINVDAAKSDEADGSMEDVEELYVEAESASVPIRTRSGSVKKATSVRISKIPEFTEEEEEQEMYTDGASQGNFGRPPSPPPEPELYDDCMTEQPPSPPPEEPDEIYEPLDDLMEEEPEPQPTTPVPPASPASPMEKKKEKDKEKEKEKEKDKGKKKDKAKDESQKKEEKERKKKEEELKKMRAKFGLTDDNQKVGDGVVKANAAGGGLLKSKDLAVNKGEIIAILRTEGNPTGKWLVENEAGRIGYVSANNIEIDTSTIKNMMTAAKAEDECEEEPEDIYEPVAEEDVEDIYEEV